MRAGFRWPNRVGARYAANQMYAANRLMAGLTLIGAFGIGSSGCADGIPEGCDAWITASADAQDEIQRAFINAADDDVICLEQGDFSGFEKEITVSADGVTITGQGMDATVLDFDGQEGANGIKITGDGVTIKDLQVKNTPGDGIRADVVDDITFERVKVTWEAEDGLSHGAYGLYPVGCDGVTIRDSVAEGARDAGVYVGQSSNIVVEGTEAAHNVAGIEIENSFDAEVRGNHAHENVGGLLIFNLPGLQQASGGRTKAFDNVLEANNTPSFAEAGTAVAAVPRGTGLILLAAQGSDIHDNQIRDNDGAGVLVMHCSTVLFNSGCNDPEYDKFPRGNWIHDNVFTGNGNKPPDFIVDMLGGDMGNIDLPIPEIFWDGGYEGCPAAGIDSVPTDDLNCFSGNTSDTGVDFVNFNICDGLMNQSNDIGPMDCTHAGLPPMDQ